MAAALDRDTLEAAARWYVDLREATPGPALLAAHHDWLARDPRHRQAWERVERLERSFAPATTSLARPTLLSARSKRRATLKLLSLLLVGGSALTLGSRSPVLRGSFADYRTATGERRGVTLEDGTRLELNTATAVDIRYAAQLREVRLLDGEILVQTAKDATARPFVVHTPQGSVRALGTRFVVRNDGQSSQVSVLQHTVEVRAQNMPSQPQRVEAGQTLRFAADGNGRPRPLDVNVDAWTRDMLVVDDWALDDFLSELGRYRPGHLGCDPAVARLRISGGFHLGDTDAVLDNLALTLPLRVRRYTRYWVNVGPHG